MRFCRKNNETSLNPTEVSRTVTHQQKNNKKLVSVQFLLLLMYKKQNYQNSIFFSLDLVEFRV